MRPIISLPIFPAILLLLPFWLLAEPIKIETIHEHLRTGKYEIAITEVELARSEGSRGVVWDLARAQARIALGQYQTARDELDQGLLRHYFSLRTHFLAHEILKLNGDSRQANQLLDRIYRLGGNFHINFWDPPDLATLGQTLIEFGAEPRIVLENFFDKALEQDPACIEAHLASGNLALTKEDFELAITQFQKGLKFHPNSPELLYGLAQAQFSDHRPESIENLEKVLKVNPRHSGARLYLAEHYIDSEQILKALIEADTVLDTNPRHPLAWSNMALIAELRYDTAAATRLLQQALRDNPKNPQPHHYIGRKLSAKYHFKEGSQYQKTALELQPNYLPSKLQLTQDLLRTGQEAKGWELATEISEEDPYNRTAFNLTQLHEQHQKFTVLKDEHSKVLMDAKEAEIYGPDVQNLLKEARRVLHQKYQYKADNPTLLEIYPQQEDFAIRTFGSLGGAGYLGVCFGDLITMNSPASQSHAGQHNWHAILWHEYTHTITLNLTNNRIPRWLSEGISVYEEMERNPTWGQHMTPHYKQIILAEKHLPISELSSAFLRPPNPIYLQFAYFQSSLVVRYIVEEFGHEALLKILADLAEGHPINDAIQRNTKPIEELNEHFDIYIRQLADRYAPQLNLASPDDVRDQQALEEWMNDNPYTIYSLEHEYNQLLKTENYEETIPLLDQWIVVQPTPPYSDDSQNPYLLLANTYRQLGDTDKELSTLLQLAEQTPDSLAAFNRLLELAKEREDWKQLESNALRLLALNPLLQEPHRQLAKASESLKKPEQAIQSWNSLLHLDPSDPANVHFRLATLLQKLQPQSAKRHLLQALEQAPRFRDAHRMLQEFPETREGPSDNQTKGPSDK